jgi:hypothetical protein
MKAENLIVSFLLGVGVTVIITLLINDHRLSQECKFRGGIYVNDVCFNTDVLK